MTFFASPPAAALTAVAISAVDNIITPDLYTGSDDARLRAAFAAATAGCIVRLKANKTYTLAGTAQLQANVPFILEGNGATIVAPDGMSTILRVGVGNRVAYTAGAYFTTVAGAFSFTIPSGVVVAKGDMLRFESNTTRISAGSYQWGMYAVVTAISSDGTTAYLDTPFDTAYQVDKIYNCPALRGAVVRNLVLDHRAYTTSTSGISQSLVVEAVSAVIEDVTCLGPSNGYGGQGVSASGVGIVVNRCRAYDYRNEQGIPGGGRIGYGIELNGNNLKAVDCTAIDCKHSFDAGADRLIVSRNIALIRPFARNRADAPTATVNISGDIQPVYQYMLGAHAGLLNLIIEEPDAAGPGQCVALRNGDVTLQGGTLQQLTSASNNSFNRRAVASWNETPVTRFRMHGTKIILDSTPTTYQSVAVHLGFIDGTHGDVDIDGCDIVGGSTLLELQGGATANGCNFDNVQVRNTRARCCNLVTYQAAAGTSGFGTIKDLKLKNVDFIASGPVAAENSASWPLSSITILLFLRMIGFEVSDCNLTSMSTTTRGITAITIGSTATAYTIENIRIERNTIKADNHCMLIASTGPITNESIVDNHLLHNQQTGTVTNGRAIYIQKYGATADASYNYGSPTTIRGIIARNRCRQPATSTALSFLNNGQAIALPVIKDNSFNGSWVVNCQPTESLYPTGNVSLDATLNFKDAYIAPKGIPYANSAPTGFTQQWNTGDYLENNSKAVAGTSGSKYIVAGWQRVTTGTGQVIGTDWMEDRRLTGT